jgi:hypothetical protein
MAPAPPWTVPRFQAVSGSYRMRHLYAVTWSPAAAGRTRQISHGRLRPAGFHEVRGWAPPATTVHP